MAHAVEHETAFYKELCWELLSFVADKSVRCWLTKNQDDTFTDLHLQYQFMHELANPIFVEASQTLENFKTLAGDILRFYSKSYPLASPLPGITREKARRASIHQNLCV